MKKGVYIYPGSKKEFSGVKKKINNQIKALSNHFCMHEVMIEKDNASLIKRVLWRMPGGYWGAHYGKAMSEIHSINDREIIDFFYIRVMPPDRGFLSFLRNIRDSYPGAKILLEFPSYPYAQSLLKNKTMWPWFFKDKVYGKRIWKYVDRATTLENSKTILGIPTIKFLNGIDVSAVAPITRDNTSSDMIRIIAVAMMQPYHGYERLIKGLAKYYRDNAKRNIEIIMVGYGPELDFYKNLTKEYGLERRIIFKGKLEGDELDEAYQECDVALGSLGGYKIGINKFASIKLGEYLAKGLPVITGAPAYPFDKFGKEYNLDFPNDDNLIDVNKIIDFCDDIYSGKSKTEVRRKIREFAYNTVDISISMSRVIDYIKENPRE